MFAILYQNTCTCIGIYFELQTNSLSLATVDKCFRNISFSMADYTEILYKCFAFGTVLSMISECILHKSEGICLLDVGNQIQTSAAPCLGSAKQSSPAWTAAAPRWDTGKQSSQAWNSLDNYFVCCSWYIMNILWKSHHPFFNNIAKRK